MSQKQKISLTRALTLVKTLSARIDDNIATGMYLGLLKGGKPTMAGFPDTASLTARINGDYQGIIAKMENLEELRKAISAANESTEVSIGGKTYNINGALHLKKMIGHKQRLIVALRHSLNNATRLIQASEDKATVEIQATLNSLYGSEKNRTAITENATLAAQAKDAVNELHVLKLQDPLGIEAKIQSLQKEVDDVLQEIDFALSEVNAKTEIEITLNT